MSAGNVAGGEDDDHDGEAGGASTSNQSLGALCLLVHNSSGCPSKHENESAYELSSYLVLGPTQQNTHTNEKWVSVGLSICS